MPQIKKLVKEQNVCLLGFFLKTCTINYEIIFILVQLIMNTITELYFVEEGNENYISKNKTRMDSEVMFLRLINK